MTIAIIQLIAKYGIPAAELIWKEVATWKSSEEITDAHWQRLRDINDRSLEFYEGPKPPTT